MADMNDKLNGLTDTKDSTGEFDPTDIEQNKVMGILAYLSWLVLIPLFAAKGSKFARFHCNQGVLLAILEIAVWILFAFLTRIPYLGWLFLALELLINLVCLVLAVLGIVNAANGKAKELPVIGKITLLK